MKLAAKYVILALALLYLLFQLMVVLRLLPFEHILTYLKLDQNHNAAQNGTKGKTRWPIDNLTLTENAALLTSASDSIKKILLIAMWRTGSTFLGATIHSTPGVFYSYEPLIYKTYQGPNIELIHQLLNCHFDPSYLKHVNQENSPAYFMPFNTRAWESCSINSTDCSDPSIVRDQCLHFPYHLIKVVRLRLKEIVTYDKKLPPNTKVIYLTRDPRGILASRTNLTWCLAEPGCNDAKRLCTDMFEDLRIIRRLVAEAPDRYYFLQFEDLSADVVGEARKLFNFLEIPMTEHVKDFLEKHTKAETYNISRTILEAPHSIVRQSNKVAEKWRSQLSQEHIKVLSATCENVIRTLHYDLLRK